MLNSYYSYVKTNETYLDNTRHATYAGITIKTGILLFITIAVSIGVSFLLPYIAPEKVSVFIYSLMGAGIVGMISAILGRFFPKIAVVCGFIYSVAMGAMLGTITTLVNFYYPGAGTLSISATVIIFAIMLVLYAFGIIRNGSIIRMIVFGIIASLLALFIFDLIYILATGSSDYGIYIAIQALLLIYGVITLTFNFAEAEAVVKYGASKESEWSVALGMEVSLIYIYIYILRIVIFIMGNRR